MKKNRSFLAGLAALVGLGAAAGAAATAMPMNLTLPPGGEAYKINGGASRERRRKGGIKSKPGKSYRRNSPARRYPEQSDRQEMRAYRRAQGGPGLTTGYDPVPVGSDEHLQRQATARP